MLSYTATSVCTRHETQAMFGRHLHFPSWVQHDLLYSCFTRNRTLRSSFIVEVILAFVKLLSPQLGSTTIQFLWSSRERFPEMNNNGLLRSDFTFWLINRVQLSKISHCKCVKPVQFYVFCRWDFTFNIPFARVT